MTFEDLSRQLNTSVQSLQNLVQVLSAAFADMEGGGGGGGDSGDVYSSEEHVVGKWTDGTSDVYERTFYYANDILSGNNHVIDASIKPATVKAIWLESGYYQEQSRPTYHSGTGALTIVCAESIGLAIEAVGSLLHNPGVTVRYVKA